MFSPQIPPDTLTVSFTAVEMDTALWHFTPPADRRLRCLNIDKHRQTQGFGITAEFILYYMKNSVQSGNSEVLLVCHMANINHRLEFSEEVIDLFI